MDLSFDFRGPAMLAWFRNRREAEQRAAERAERLIRDQGSSAYSEARRYEREAFGR